MSITGRKDGTVIIDRAIGQFEKIVTQLTSGLALVETKHKENTKKIDSLTAENIFLEKKKTQADTFRTNLRKMLGEEAPKKEAAPKVNAAPKKDASDTAEAEK